MDKKRVLVVDDDIDLLKMMQLRLESEGYEFMGAQDVKEMFKVMRLKKPDLLILDIILPGIDGYTALKEVKEHDEFKDIPVIILTAKREKEIKKLFDFENIAFYIEKPYESGDLLQKIKSLL